MILTNGGIYENSVAAEGVIMKTPPKIKIDKVTDNFINLTDTHEFKNALAKRIERFISNRPRSK